MDAACPGSLPRNKQQVAYYKRQTKCEGEYARSGADDLYTVMLQAHLEYSTKDKFVRDIKAFPEPAIIVLTSQQYNDIALFYRRIVFSLCLMWLQLHTVICFSNEDYVHLLVVHVDLEPGPRNVCLLFDLATSTYCSLHLTPNFLPWISSGELSRRKRSVGSFASCLACFYCAYFLVLVQTIS